MGKAGRKKIKTSLGETTRRMFLLYDLEYQQMKIFYAKLKALRPFYEIKEDEQKGQ